MDEFYPKRRTDRSRERARCHACHKAYSSAYSSAYYQRPEVKAKALEYAKRWQADNRERYRESLGNWRSRNPEYLAEYCAAWREDNPDYAKRWFQDNPDAMRRARALRRARIRAATVVPFTSEQLEARWDYYGNRCWICREPATATDHVKPLAKGGAHMLCNLRPICNNCNSSKGDHWPFSAEIFRACGTQFETRGLKNFLASNALCSNSTPLPAHPSNARSEHSKFTGNSKLLASNLYPLVEPLHRLTMYFFFNPRTRAMPIVWRLYISRVPTINRCRERPLATSVARSVVQAPAAALCTLRPSAVRSVSTSARAVLYCLRARSVSLCEFCLPLCRSVTSTEQRL